MSDQTKSETAPKKINAVSSRLLQNTAASSARSGSTPTLTRKFGSQKNDRQTPPTHGRPRSGVVRTGSFRNDKTVVSNGRVMTSSTKKSVFNSTSEAENVVPADWDASAIAPPGAAVKGQGPRKKLEEPKTDLRIRTAAKKPMARGPLKAISQTAMKPIKDNPTTKSVFKRLHSSNTSLGSNNSSWMEDDEGTALYDEYLLSKLMALNVKQNCEDAKQSANKDILELWTAIEKIRAEIVAQEKANLEIKMLSEYHTAASKNAENLECLIKSLKTFKLEVKSVADALENTMHQLPVEGASVDSKKLEQILVQHTEKLNKLKSSKNCENSKSELIELLEKFHKNLEISNSTSDKCNESLKSLRTETLKAESFKISQQQIEESMDADLLIDSLMSIPPEPTLIDI